VCRSCNNLLGLLPHKIHSAHLPDGNLWKWLHNGKAAMNCVQGVGNLGIIMWTELYLNHQVDWIVSTWRNTLKKHSFFFCQFPNGARVASIPRQIERVFYRLLSTFKMKNRFWLTFVLVTRVFKTRNLFWKRKTLLQGGQVTPKRFKLFNLPQ
jgi:hypothetical protein